MTKISTNLYPPTVRVNPPNNNKLPIQQAPRLTERELLKIFPEAKGIIPEKLKEWKGREKEIKGVIRHNLKIVRNRVKDKFSRWFWREAIKMEVANELLENNSQIQRLKRLSNIPKGMLPSPKILTQEKIERARSPPILEIAQSFLKLRKQGEKTIDVHQERQKLENG